MATDNSTGRGRATVSSVPVVREPIPASERAPELPAGYVKEAPGLGYFVKSSSTEGAWWLVHANTCSCPAGQAGRASCRHRRQVEAFCRALDEKHARPKAKPAPASMFVD